MSFSLQKVALPSPFFLFSTMAVFTLNPNLQQAFVDAIWARGGRMSPSTLTVYTTDIEHDSKYFPVNKLYFIFL